MPLLGAALISTAAPRKLKGTAAGKYLAGRGPLGLEISVIVSTTPTPLDAPETLAREFLEIRARLLQVAASLDRLDRASGSIDNDPRLAGIAKALEVLASNQPDRAERIQLIFSRAYDDQWLARFKSENTRS